MAMLMVFNQTRSGLPSATLQQTAALPHPLFRLKSGFILATQATTAPHTDFILDSESSDGSAVPRLEGEFKNGAAVVPPARLFTHTSCRLAHCLGWMPNLHPATPTLRSEWAARVRSRVLPPTLQLTVVSSLRRRRRPIWNISGNVGLVSAGRINKDTPPLTTPSHTSKSSAMDISSHTFQIEIHGVTSRRFRHDGCPRLV